MRGWGLRCGRLVANCPDLRILWMVGEQVVLLLSVVAIWNNYFLPLIIFSQNRLNPLTVGPGCGHSARKIVGTPSSFPWW